MLELSFLLFMKFNYSLSVSFLPNILILMWKLDFFLGGVCVRHLIDHLEELEQLLKGIAVMKELTLRTKDYLVSFGECLSTRIFAAYLNKIGIKAHQVRNILRQLCIISLPTCQFQQ